MTKKILYVEDHFNNMLLVKRIVQAERHEFFAAPTAMEGWKIATEKQPDLIFIDLRLPGDVDGFDFLRLLKGHEELRCVPAVVLTAYGNGDVERQAKAMGCDGFLRKPADILQIRDTIRDYLGIKPALTVEKSLPLPALMGSQPALP